MKVIGEISTKYTDDSRYSRGNIVLLTEREVAILKMLQNAAKRLKSDGYNFDPNWRDNLDNAAMDDLFMLIHKYTEARFAVNDFKCVIENLENILGND